MCQTKGGLDPAKTDSKKVVPKTAEETGEWIGNRIAEKIVKPNLADKNSRNAEEVVIPPEKKIRNTKGIKVSIVKWNITKSLTY